MNRIKENLVCYHNDGLKKQWIYKFNNNYGASIIKGGCAYGNKYYPYELMFVKFDKNNFIEQVAVPFAYDIKGYLGIKEVKKYLNKIKTLEEETLKASKKRQRFITSSPILNKKLANSDTQLEKILEATFEMLEEEECQDIQEKI